jgi:hypothetical protein
LSLPLLWQILGYVSFYILHNLQTQAHTNNSFENLEIFMSHLMLLESSPCVGMNTPSTSWGSLHISHPRHHLLQGLVLVLDDKCELFSLLQKTYFYLQFSWVSFNVPKAELVVNLGYEMNCKYVL